MEIITVGIDTGLVATVFLVVFFHHELATLGTIHVDGLEMTDKVALRIIGTTVELLATALCLSGYNLTSTTRSGAASQGNGAGIVALWETRTSQEKAESTKLFYHVTTAFVANLVGGLVHGTLKAFVGGHDVFHLVSEGEEKVSQHL